MRIAAHFFNLSSRNKIFQDFIMLLPGENSPKSWLIITILVSTIIAFSESSEGKTYSREYNPRALDGESSNDESLSEKKKPSSEEVMAKKEESSKELVKPEKSDEDEAGNDDKNSDSGDDNTVRVTRGPKTGDFEPEEDNPKIHEKYEKNSESDNNSDADRRRRYKRQIDRFWRFGNVGNRR